MRRSPGKRIVRIRWRSVGCPRISRVCGSSLLRPAREGIVASWGDVEDVEKAGALLKTRPRMPTKMTPRAGDRGGILAAMSRRASQPQAAPSIPQDLWQPSVDRKFPTSLQALAPRDEPDLLTGAV